jgi:hypothetical protein
MYIRQLRAFLVRLASIFGQGARDRELAEELESHLQMHIEDNVRAGMSPEAEGWTHIVSERVATSYSLVEDLFCDKQRTFCYSFD